MSQTPTPAPALSAAERTKLLERLAQRGREVIAAKRATGADVVDVAEWGLGGPVKLTLRCTKPGCGKTHVRKVQDAHQAHLCEGCRKDANKAKRSGGTSKDALRAELAAAKAELAKLMGAKA